MNVISNEVVSIVMEPSFAVLTHGNFFIRLNSLYWEKANDGVVFCLVSTIRATKLNVKTTVTMLTKIAFLQTIGQCERHVVTPIRKNV